MLRRMTRLLVAFGVVIGATEGPAVAQMLDFDRVTGYPQQLLAPYIQTEMKLSDEQFKKVEAVVIDYQEEVAAARLEVKAKFSKKLPPEERNAKVQHRLSMVAALNDPL